MDARQFLERVGQRPSIDGLSEPASARAISVISCGSDAGDHVLALRIIRIRRTGFFFGPEDGNCGR